MGKKSYITVTDQYCGAGGSTTGAKQAGAEVRLALNHDPLAIRTHNTNHPEVDHDCTDVQACDPRKYPSTDILITSPECTNHSLAKGKMRLYQRQLELFGKVELDPTEERSRATMWDVCRFAEAHRYNLVIVENVVEARWWPPFEAWLQAMHLLGYEHEIVYFNSMFAYPTPQSRDRMYVVFWRKGNPKPDLKFTPPAWCYHCQANVAAVQSWKKPLRPWGKYQTQYIYCCPTCARAVTPYYFCAANAIDWSLPAPRIGERQRPLKEKTLRRIEIGLKKFGRQSQLIGNYSPGWARPVTDPTGTVTCQDHHALTVPPFLVDLTRTKGVGTSVDEAYPTQTGTELFGLSIPPFLVDLAYSHGHDRRSSSGDDPWPTQTSQQTLALAVPAFLVGMAGAEGQKRPVDLDDPFPTQTGTPTYALAVPPFIVEMRNKSTVGGVEEALSTLTAHAVNHAVCIPPALLHSYYSNDGGHPLTDAVPTVPTHDRHSLVVPPFLMGVHTATSYRQMTEAMTAVVAEGNHHFLAQPGQVPSVEECGFRMLQPHEIQAAMAFPSDYVVLGNQRQKVKQLGNAVTPPVMQLLMERCLATLD